MIDKTVEYWAVFMGMAIYLVTRDRDTETLLFRISKTIASGLIAVGTSDAVADYLSVSDTIATVFIMAFGLIFLDLITGVARDREFIKEILKSRLGGKSGK